MYEQKFSVDFGDAGKVTVTVESERELSLYNAIGALETAAGMIVDRHNELIISQEDD